MWFVSRRLIKACIVCVRNEIRICSRRWGQKVQTVQAVQAEAVSSPHPHVILSRSVVFLSNNLELSCMPLILCDISDIPVVDDDYY